MMHFVVVICVGLLTVGLEAQPTDTGPVNAAESARRCLKQALADRQKGDIQGAIAQLRQALQLEPDFQDAHGMLGELLLTQGFAEEALPHLQKAGNAYLQGLALLELKRLPEAVMKLLAADAQNPDDPDVLFNLGEASGTLMQRAYISIARNHPGSPRALELQARNYLAQGRGDLAEQAFRNVLKLRPELPGIHMELGRILQEQRGDLDGAEREYRIEVQIRPGSPEAAWRVGSVLLKKGQPKEALAELQRSDQLRPDMLDTLLDLGKAYLMENQIEPAEKAFRRILVIHDADEVAAAAHLQLSQICRRKGLTVEAEQHLKRFRELSKAPGQQ
jgi:tetratricopeptide (TPR) repeat protein